MIIFKSMTDLNQLAPSDPAIDVVKKHLVRMADLYPENGYLVLVDSLNDFDEELKLPEVKRPWVDIIHLSEGCILQDGYFFLTYLTNNEYGIDVILPDADWLNTGLREALEGTAQ